MKRLIHLGLFVFLFSSLTGCNGQKKQTVSNSKILPDNNNIVGGPFENGEFMYISMPENIKFVGIIGS